MKTKTIFEIAIIIPVFNRKNITLSCLKRLDNIDKSLSNITIVVVDDGSTDGTEYAISKDFPEVIVLKGSGNLWWTGAINLGVNWALDRQYSHVFFLNDDMLFNKYMLNEILLVSLKYNSALVSALKLFKGKSGDEIATSVFNMKGPYLDVCDENEGLPLKSLDGISEIEGHILTGAGLLVPVDVFLKIGMLDEINFPHNWGDFEFTRRASVNSFRCILSTKAHIYTDKNNPNYHKNYLIESTRLEYLYNLFDRHKYTYGFGNIMRMSYMHRPFLIATKLFIRRLLGETRWIILKVILPNNILSNYVSKKQSKNNQ